MSYVGVFLLFHFSAPLRAQERCFLTILLTSFLGFPSLLSLLEGHRVITEAHWFGDRRDGTMGTGPQENEYSLRMATSLGMLSKGKMGGDCIVYTSCS